MSDVDGPRRNAFGQVFGSAMVAGMGLAAGYALTQVWRLAIDDGMTLADWRVTSAWAASLFGAAGLLASSRFGLPGRPFLSLGLSVLPMTLLVEPSFVLDRDVDALAASLSKVQAALETGLTGPRPGIGDAALQCEALKRFLLALHDRVSSPEAPSAPGCGLPPPNAGTRPAPFDRLSHVRDIFLGGPMGSVSV